MADLTNDELMAAIGDAPIRFWTCPVREHGDRTDDSGRPVVTVEWQGDIARCTAPGCARTSRPGPADSTYTPDPADVLLVARALATEDADWGYDHGFSSIADDAETHGFASAALVALAAAGRLLPEPVETVTEWAVYWHSGDSDGIVLSEEKIGSREQAKQGGKGRIGEYGITRYTLHRREHRKYAAGSTWIGTWEEVPDA